MEKIETPPTTELFLSHTKITFMITNISVKIKNISQENYNYFLETISFHSLICSCGMSGQFIKHGFYKRTAKTPERPVILKIQRVKCKHCDKTHALFPECIVPYSQILLEDHLKIVTAYNEKVSYKSIMISNPYIDESNIKYIIKKYLLHWKERIISFVIPMDSKLTYSCLCSFKRQFMQIKCTSNILSA
jgi:hypothetical protein